MRRTSFHLRKSKAVEVMDLCDYDNDDFLLGMYKCNNDIFISNNKVSSRNRNIDITEAALGYQNIIINNDEDNDLRYELHNFYLNCIKFKICMS